MRREGKSINQSDCKRSRTSLRAMPND